MVAGGQAAFGCVALLAAYLSPEPIRQRFGFNSVHQPAKVGISAQRDEKFHSPLGKTQNSTPKTHRLGITRVRGLKKFPSRVVSIAGKRTRSPTNAVNNSMAMYKANR